MKLLLRPVTTAMALLLGISSFSQSYLIFYDHYQKPAGVKVLVEGRTESFKLDGNMPDYLQFQGNDSYSDIFNEGSDGNLASGQTRDEVLEYMEPGVLPEADLIRDAAYTHDGSRIAVICQHSGNIFFYDSQTYEVLHITDVGTGPIDLCLTMDRAYVACLYSKEIYVIDLDDYTVSDIVDLDRQPSQVEVSPDGSIIYVAFPSFIDGSVAAFSASTHELLFERPELFIHHYGYYGHNGRSYYMYYRFCLSADGMYLTGTSDPGTVVIFDGTTGAEALRYDDRFFCGFNTSSTGDTLYLLTLTDDDVIILYRLRSDDFTKIDSISRPVSDVYFGQDDLAVSGDGNRVLTQDSWNDAYLLFDFETMGSSAFPANAFLTQIINISYDRKYAICHSESGLKLFDMDDPGFLSSYQCIMGHFGTPSTSSYRFLSPSDLFAFENVTNRNEKFNVIDFQDPDAIILDTCIIASELPEADMTTRACLSGDGKKIVSANFLSANVSVIDMNTQTLENLPEFDNIWIVTPIPGSEDVLLSGQTAATYDMAFTSDSRRACVASASNISPIIYLDGADSYIENELMSISGHD